MERDVLSIRQMMVLLVTALLAPASDLLPVLSAQKAGGGGWLTVLGALPLLLIALWAVSGVIRDRGAGQMLGGLPRYIIIMVYLTWTLLTLMLSLRLCRARLSVIYGEGPAFVFTLVLLIVAVWMGLGKTSALARAGEVFYLALAVALAGVLFLSVFKVEGENLLLSAEEAAALPEGSVAAAGLLLNILPAAVLGKKVSVKPRNTHRAVGWTVAFCIVITLLLGAIIGCAGPQLTARLPAPFLTMVQGLGIKGTFQRTEALAAALWTLSDLTLAGLLLHTWRDLASQLHGGKWSRWSILPVAAAAIVGGWMFFASVDETRIFCCRVLPVIGLILGLICPLSARFLLRLQKKRP